MTTAKQRNIPIGQSNFDLLVEAGKSMFNHICILHDHELVRLVGIGEDQYDYYYIVVSLSPNHRIPHKHPRKFWASFVGDCYSLKDKLSPEQYQKLDNNFLTGGSDYEKKLYLINEDAILVTELEPYLYSGETK